MTPDGFAALIKSELTYTPNNQQEALIGALARFCAGMNPEYDEEKTSYSGPSVDRAFIINGYAGTGKTSLVSALVRALTSLKTSVVLMAPTGRAAKVFSSYSGFRAATIHRRIYKHSLRGEIPGLRDNRDNNTLYIVDEASMLSTQDPGRGSDLLTDLITYVFAGNNNRLILMGDTAQLPPVGETDSPAMNADILRGMGLKVSQATLTRVVRQGARSGILANAVNIRREMLAHPDRVPVPLTDGFNDVTAVTSEDLAEVIDGAYRTNGIDETVIITRSNLRASEFNKAIRSQVLYFEEEIVRGEPLLIAKNNYYWTRQARRKDIDFIANGDIFRVTRIIGTEIRYGFRFADVEIVPVILNQEIGDEERDADSSDAEVAPLQVKIFLETLANGHPALPVDRMRMLYEQLLLTEYQGVADPMQALASNPYWNALQAKYAYCVTCHKAQGGQWKQAIVDISYINPDAVGPDLYRWMYTATTRAKNKLTYLVDTPTY